MLLKRSVKSLSLLFVEKDRFDHSADTDDKNNRNKNDLYYVKNGHFSSSPSTDRKPH